MRTHLFFCVVFFLKALSCLGQAPVSGFNLDPNACRQQQLEFTNTSTGATAYEWDFCANDSETLSLSEDLATLSGLSGGYGYKIVTDGNLWFGFAVSQNNHSVYRLDFGNSPLNIPTVTNLGNVGGLLSFPNGIEIYRHAGNWYGFVGLFDPNSGIVRLDFGTSLTNSPTAQNLGMFGLSGRFWGMRVVEQAGNLILVVINRNTNSIVRINYRNSFNNSIVNATHVFSDAITGANLTPGFDITKVDNDWVALVASDLNSSIIQLKFTNDILTTPNVEGSYSINISRPMQVKILNEGTHYVAAVTSEFVNLRMIDYKDLNPVNTPTEISHTLPLLFAVDAFRFKGKSVIQGVGANNRLKNLVFQSSCGASSDFSESFEPAGILYNSSGIKNIELRSFNTDGISSYSRSLTVSTNLAPDIDFATDGNVCADHDIAFEADNTSGNITGYLWSFDDTNTSTSANPNHQYSLSGNYNVNLRVTSSIGCENYVEKMVSVYNEPDPNFTLPTNNPLCTNQAYVFNNTSNVDSGFPVTWLWEVNGVENSSEEDLTYAFDNILSQNVKLIASIPGCENEITKSVNTLIEGPDADFTFTGSCEDETIVFTNNSTGSITSYLWNFDNGQSSTNTSPLYAYPNIGTYDVELTAFSVNGCNNTFSKPVTIRSKPQVNFEASLPPFSCSGTPTQFNDLTPGPVDSNLTSWQWNFGDAGNASTLRNPQYTYAVAANYDVSLTVSTNFGCSASLQLSIPIAQSPVPDFTHSAFCEDVPVPFSGTSSGTVVSWNWTISGTSYTVQNPAHTFVNPGNSSATLSVTGSNSCVGQVTKPVTVPVKLSPDFTFLKNCVAQQTQFTDITTAGSDPIISRNWNFGSANDTGSPVIFAFSDAGNTNVTLVVNTQSGCSYPITKVVNILASPQANFVASPQINAPRTINFINTSTNANSYLWSFHDPNNTTSSQTSPQFTYLNFGQYNVDLTASNAQNCIHTISKILDVVIPSYNVEVSGLELIESPGNVLHPAVTIFNHGNVPIFNVELLIEAAGIVTEEIVATTILPNSSYRQELSYQIQSENDLNYLCIEANFVDQNPNDNRVCLNMQKPFISFDPYPNPGKGTLHVHWISSEDGFVNLSLMNSMGQEIQSFRVNSSEGLTPFEISTSGLGSGTYLLKIQHKNLTKVYRIFVLE